MALFTPEMLCSNGQSHLRFPSSLVSTDLLALPDSFPGSRFNRSGLPVHHCHMLCIEFWAGGLLSLNPLPHLKNGG